MVHLRPYTAVRMSNRIPRMGSQTGKLVIGKLFVALENASFLRFLGHTQLDTPHSIGLLWTGDQPVAKTST
jgi:hypothetical protein